MDADDSNDICLTTHCLSDMQSKTEELSTVAQKIGKICQKTKIRLFKSNVLSILLYG